MFDSDLFDKEANYLKTKLKLNNTLGTNAVAFRYSYLLTVDGTQPYCFAVMANYDTLIGEDGISIANNNIILMHSNSGYLRFISDTSNLISYNSPLNIYILRDSNNKPLFYGTLGIPQPNNYVEIITNNEIEKQFYTENSSFYHKPETENTEYTFKLNDTYTVEVEL